ncbi:MAG: hypothetical protein Q8Q14_05625 [Gemmatimonadales bacterium]|nr:hypothetical protein [Gemmatimonadales bacterium]
MTDQEYLQAVLDEQTLAEDGQEIKDLDQHRKEVKSLLTAKFGPRPALREGGSKAKGTMVREAYDLDLAYYFAHQDTSGGETIEEIYENVERVLQGQYHVQRKGVAVRLFDPEGDIDFHVDVIPGRFINGDDGDAFLYPATSDKERLQTNLETHLDHVRESGVVDAIRLQKLWKARRGIGLKTFALELLVIDSLEGKQNLSLPKQLTHVWTGFRDNIENLTIEDPANSNNDLSEMINYQMRGVLREQSRATLQLIDANGWEAVFGQVDRASVKAAKVEALRRIVTTSPSPAKPWSFGS